MLHIILLILKIIGIVLLSVIGILLLAIACVLFVPVRYRIRLTREEGEDKPPVMAYVKVTWLLHFVNILIQYPSKVIVRARVFVFTLFRLPKKDKKSEKENHSEQTASEKKKKSTLSTVTEEHKPSDKDGEGSVQEETEHKESDESEEPEESGEPGELEEKKSLFAKIRNILTKIKQIFEKIKAFFENIQYTIRKFCDKIKAVLDNIQYYHEVLDSDPFRQSLASCKRELSWLLKKMKPNKFEADFIVGMEDPATTGEILAVYGILYPLIGQHVRVVGDFDCEKTHIEGQLHIRGRMSVITFLRVAGRIYFNKDIKKLIKLLKKEAV